MSQPSTIAEFSTLLLQERIDPRDLVEMCLTRIDQYDTGLLAWVYVDADGAREQAEAMGRELAMRSIRGPLHGIPIGIKDIIDVRGMPTRAGSVLTDRAAADEDAPVVARLREAGAIILGKTVTTEFACFDPPPTRNPWRADRTPGGSSSGSAVAVATGMCLAAVGTQTGGSITRPASYCGIAGFKPTFGRVAMRGVAPVSAALDHVGPMARCVSDLAVMFCAMIGESIEPIKYELADPLPPRLGLVESYFLEQASAEAAEMTRAACTIFSSGGASVTTVSLPDDFARFRDMHALIMAHDAARVQRERYERAPNDFGANLRGMIERGIAASPAEHEAALKHKKEFTARALGWFENVDVLVTPATVTAAPTCETTGDPRFNSPWSYAGFPTVSLPCGIDPHGLPLGVQLIGKPDTDFALLAAASWCERHLRFNEFPPMCDE